MKAHNGIWDKKDAALITGITGQDGSYLAELYGESMQCME